MVKENKRKNNVDFFALGKGELLAINIKISFNNETFE
jgi:hypothetical protein